MSTTAYRDMMEQDYGDPKTSALMEKCWKPTPFVVYAFAGDRDRQEAMRRWCYREMGERCSPIHDQPGLWTDGSATLFEWCYFGFASQELLDRFLSRWRDDLWKSNEVVAA